MAGLHIKSPVKTDFYGYLPPDFLSDVFGTRDRKPQLAMPLRQNYTSTPMAL